MITDVKEQPRAGGSRESDGTASYERHYFVYSNSITENVYDVTTAAGIPVVGEAHPDDSQAIVQSVRPTQNTDNRSLWEVTVEYSSGKTGGSTSVFRPPRPWNRPSKLKWGKYTVEEALVKDVNGTLIRNSAGDRFNPPAKIERHHPMLMVTRYQKNFSILSVLRYLDHVNSVDTKIAGFLIGAKQALMTNVEGSQIEVDGTPCWECTYEILFAESWRKEFLNQGFYYWQAVTGGNIKVQYKDDAGKAMTSPALLTVDGFRLPVGGTPTYLICDVYPTIDFGPLGLA